MVPYVDAVVAVTVRCVLLFVLHVCLRECDGTRLRQCWCGGWMRCDEYRTCGWYTWFRHCV